MFATQERSRIRDALIARARADDQIVGAALVGSAARGEEDAWSDIDVVLQLAPDADEPAVVEAWTRWIDDRFTVADTLDVVAGARYRVLLLASSLQIDVSFWPYAEFRGTGESFQLVFGAPNPPSLQSAPDLDALIGMGWLYALHARSAIARGRPWQAVMMLDDLRNQIISLACIRHGLNPWHGRDVDRLPPLSKTLFCGVDHRRCPPHHCSHPSGCSSSSSSPKSRNTTPSAQLHSSSRSKRSPRHRTN